MISGRVQALKFSAVEDFLGLDRCSLFQTGERIVRVMRARVNRSAVHRFGNRCKTFFECGRKKIFYRQTSVSQLEQALQGELLAQFLARVRLRQPPNRRPPEDSAKSARWC